MRSKNYKNVLIVGACDKNTRIHSYVVDTDNSTKLQLIDATKDAKELETFDESYLDYIDKTLLFFIGGKLERVDAIIFYSMEANFKELFIKKLKPECLIIDFFKILMSARPIMTEEKLIKQIACFDKKFRIELENWYSNGMLLFKSAQDPHSYFSRLPMELFFSIAKPYSKLLNSNSFLFFKSIRFPDNDSNDLVQNAKISGSPLG